MISSLQRSHPISPVSLPFSQPARCTRSSKLITLYRPAVTSSIIILNRAFRYSVPILWNSLPAELCCPKDSGSPGTNPISKSTFLSKLKTDLFHLFHESYPASSESESSILIGKSMTTRLTSLHRLSNTLTNNDSNDYLFRLLFLLYCMTQIYLYVRCLIKHYY